MEWLTTAAFCNKSPFATTNAGVACLARLARHALGSSEGDGKTAEHQLWLLAGGALGQEEEDDDPAVVALAQKLGAEICPPASGPSESVAAAFEKTGAPLVVTTADHALLEPAWVTELVAKTRTGADLSIMMARRQDIERSLPGTQRTYLRFADGEWSGCNLFYLASPRASAALATWRAVEADRKRPWKLVARLGLPNLVAYALGRLTLEDGLARLGRRIGVNAALVRASDGRAAIDVDKPRDLDDVLSLIAREIL